MNCGSLNCNTAGGVHPFRSGKGIRAGSGLRFSLFNIDFGAEA